jgi:hypothetical protein
MIAAAHDRAEQRKRKGGRKKKGGADRWGPGVSGRGNKRKEKRETGRCGKRCWAGGPAGLKGKVR